MNMHRNNLCIREEHCKCTLISSLSQKTYIKKCKSKQSFSFKILFRPLLSCHLLLQQSSSCTIPFLEVLWLSFHTLLYLYTFSQLALQNSTFMECMFSNKHPLSVILISPVVAKSGTKDWFGLFDSE